MINNQRPSLKFFAAGMIGLMVAPLLILLGPPIIMETMYFNKDNIVLMTPWANFILFAIAFMAITVNLFLLAWKRNKWIYSITAVVLVVSIICAIQSTKSYTAIDDSGLIFLRYGDRMTYHWNDFESIHYYYDQYGGPGIYEFTLKMGKIIEIEETGQFINEVRNKIYALASNNHIYIKELPKE